MGEEFRVFLPELHNLDYWIPRAEQSEYCYLLRTVIADAENIVSAADVEKRLDIYSVVNDSIGLKLRVRALFFHYCDGFVWCS